MSPFAATIVLVARPVVAAVLFLNLLPVLIWLERKGSAYMQDRVGPNRAYVPGLGLRMGGLVHSLADVLKLATKRELLPAHVNRRFYLMAPFFALFSALLAYAVVPFADDLRLPSGAVVALRGIDLDLGILWVLAAGSISVFAIVLAGWASNNKYALLGGLRATAQMVSYEVALVLAISGAVLAFGTVDLAAIVRSQGDLLLGFVPKWGIVLQPFGFLLVAATALAETNRAPFDLPEGESEIVGFHVEYSGFKFAMFYMAEYMHIATQAAVLVTVFLGGWQIPWMTTETLVSSAPWIVPAGLAASAAAFALVGAACLRYHARNRTRWRDSRRREGAVLSVVLGFLPAAACALLFFAVPGDAPAAGPVFAAVAQSTAFLVKTLLVAWIFIWIRWTLPRFRYDQLMTLGWRALLPLAILNLFATAAVALLVG